jgi:hypothetical protein
VKLAEALALRAYATRRIEQLRTRIVANARFQEGEEPAEDAAALLAEASAVLDQLEDMIRRINPAHQLDQRGDPDRARRHDHRRAGPPLRAARPPRVITAAADAAAGRSQGMGRQLRSELKMLTALPVAQLRAQADDLARQLREVDVRIQQSNWAFDLLE